jgi:hypothetical protein
MIHPQMFLRRPPGPGAEELAVGNPEDFFQKNGWISHDFTMRNGDSKKWV